MILSLARMEWWRLMRSPLAWTLLAFSCCLLSWQLLETLETYSGLLPANRGLGLTAQLSLQLFGFAAVLILFITPILTTRQFSELFRNGSYTLFSSSPLSLTSILLGKFFGVMFFQGLLIFMPLALSLLLVSGTSLDFGLLAAASLGLTLLVAGFTAIGLYFSTLSSTPAISLAGSYGLLLLISILGQDNLGQAGGLLHWVAWPPHYLSLQLGLVRSADLAYLVLLCVLFLGLALHQLDTRRSG